ncbi:MAG: hypothetical protein IJD61_03205, partial [Clostridia bacterium]|nr:hypothetical protein [Clostridia bacterium]
VDTHSDLAFGPPGPAYVMNVVLARNPEIRERIEMYREAVELDEANYLLFALAFRWISSLDNVRNPRSRPDIPREILAAGRADVIQLTSFAARLFEEKNGKEPEIRFNVYEDHGSFRAEGPYDFVTLAISPRYSPKEADELIPIIGRYIKIRE